jgi:5'-methylthioadenosine phosphorylase
MKMDREISFAVIGGVGFLKNNGYEKVIISSTYGDVECFIGKTSGINFAFIPRHSISGPHIPPHRINYHAIICAVKKLGVKQVIATNSVGSMKGHPTGSFFIPDDFIDFTKGRESTYFHDQTVHVDMNQPYCPRLRQSLMNTLQENREDLFEGTYVCTEGPRFETKAEIQMMASFGDVVGMTGLPEVVLAREMEICYASICTVTNPACSMGNERLTADEVVSVLKKREKLLFDLIINAFLCMDEKMKCTCRLAKDQACL